MNSHNQVLNWKERLAEAENASRAGNREQAELLYNQSLKIAGDLGDQERVTTLIHLADFYATGKVYTKAEPLYRQASEIYERTFGSHNFIGAMCLSSLGDVLQALGKDAEATTIKTRVTEILGALA
jgi:hypothetical protein